MGTFRSAVLICSIGALASGDAAFASDALDELIKKYGNTAAPAQPEAAKVSAPTRDPASSTKAKPAKIKKKKAVEPVAPPAPKDGAATAKPPAPVVPPPPPPSVKTEPAEEEEKEEPSLFGDWGGMKSKAKEAGVELGLYYKGSTMSVMSGGLKKGTHYYGNIDVWTDLDFEKLAHLKGFSLHLYGLGNHGGKPSELVGNAQGVDNIEAPSTFKLYEAYFQQQLDDRFLIQLGLRDLNADYFSTESSKPFLNPTFGIGGIMAQTGVNGPSIFPTTSLAINTKYQSPSSFYFQAGVFDAQAGDPNKPYGTQITHNHDAGQLLVSELGWAGEKEGTPFKSAVGAWKYTVADAAQDATKQPAQNWGVYALLDHRLYKGLSGFVRHGMAESTVNSASWGTDIGLTYKGLFPSREDDVLGLGAAYLKFADDYKVANSISKDGETVIELLYRFQFPIGVVAEPGVQYVLDPGGASGVDNAWIGAFRLEVNFQSLRVRGGSYEKVVNKEKAGVPVGCAHHDDIGGSCHGILRGYDFKSFADRRRGYRAPSCSISGYGRYDARWTAIHRLSRHISFGHS